MLLTRNNKTDISHYRDGVPSGRPHRLKIPHLGGWARADSPGGHPDTQIYGRVSAAPRRDLEDRVPALTTRHTMLDYSIAKLTL